MPALSERLYHAVPLSLPVLSALFLNQGCFDWVQLFRSCFPLPWVDHLALWISMTWLSHCWVDSSHSSVWWFSVQWHLQRTSEALPSVLLYLYWCLSLYCRWIFFFFDWNKLNCSFIDQGHICILYIGAMSLLFICLDHVVSSSLCTPKLLILSPEPSPKVRFLFGEAGIVSKDCPWMQLQNRKKVCSSGSSLAPITKAGSFGSLHRSPFNGTETHLLRTKSAKWKWRALWKHRAFV